MTTVGKRVTWLLALLFMIGVVPMLGSVSILKGATVEKRAETWVEGRLANLPEGLNEYAALPKEYRRAVYHRLSAEQRVSLWHEQLDLFAETARLSPSTLSTIRYIRQALTVHMFKKDRTAEDLAALTALCGKLKAALTPDQAKIFGELGSIGRPSFAARLQGAQVRLLEAIASTTQAWFGAYASNYGTRSVICSCNIGSWCSCWECRNGPPYPYDLCFPEWSPPDECGCFNAYECNGNCDPEPCCK